MVIGAGMYGLKPVPSQPHPAEFSRLNGSMLRLFRTLSRIPSLKKSLALAATAACAQMCAAQGTHLWAQSKFEEFEKGTPQGVSITSDGRLRQGPALKEIVTTPSTF